MNHGFMKFLFEYCPKDHKSGEIKKIAVESAMLCKTKKCQPLKKYKDSSGIHTSPETAFFSANIKPKKVYANRVSFVNSKNCSN